MRFIVIGFLVSSSVNLNISVEVQFVCFLLFEGSIPQNEAMTDRFITVGFCEKTDIVSSKSRNNKQLIFIVVRIDAAQSVGGCVGAFDTIDRESI